MDLLSQRERNEAAENRGTEELLKDKYRSYSVDLTRTWVNLLDHRRSLSQEFRRTTILVSMSERGTIAYHNEEFMHCHYSGVLEPSTFVGAGDSFLGGFIIRQCKSNDVKKVIKAGVATSIARLTDGGGKDEAHIDAGRIVSIMKDGLLCVDTFKEPQDPRST